MKVAFLALLLSVAAIAEPLTWREVSPPRGLPSHPQSRVWRTDSPEFLFHGYVDKDESPYLDIYTATESSWKRQAHLDVAPSWTEGNFSIAPLDSNKKEGWVLWSESGGVSAVAFPDGWGGDRVWGGCDRSEFSTTGWSTTGVSEGEGPFSFYNRHEWPGEETEEGRQVDSTTDSYVWNWEKRDFVLESDS